MRLTSLPSALYRAGRRAARRVLLPLLRPRRFDACCCGLSKTGTHSMAGIFEGYRSEHHPDAEARLALSTGYLKGETSAAVAERELRRRDRDLWLEMESSALAGILIEPFVRACPEKRFILTLRDVYSWVESWLDHGINSPPRPGSGFAALDRIRLRVDDTAPTRHDTPLTERGFAPLACYFQLWCDHNTRVLRAVPESRLLVVKTSEITARIPEIAAWVGAPLATLRVDRAWLFAAPAKHRVLAALDPAYVQDTAERFCSPLMRRYFPDASVSLAG